MKKILITLGLSILLLSSYATETKQIKQPIVPEVLYLAVEEKYVQGALETGIAAPKGKEIILSKTIEEALALEKNTANIQLLIINTRKMYINRHTFILDKNKEWSVKAIKGKYIIAVKL